LLWLAWTGHERAFLMLLIGALVSDIVDGQIARCWNLATELGATLDSWADFLTALTLPFALYWLQPETIPRVRIAFVVALVSYLLPIALGFLKFRRLTSYHTLLARVAAYALGASIVVLFARGPTLPFQISVLVLALAASEEIALTVVLPAPRSNVGSLRRLLRARRNEP
ncbi:MAG: CDP-alcohol phosphatidyltransferase family protein, partial [Verrucomicrobiota bacterium]|nr:CDP-alcohol phosphatidyltransferase family protein [Verrucomicrobiota bacterium]